VLMLSALRRDGVDGLVQAIADHRRWLGEGGRLAQARQAQAAHWLVEGVREAFGRDGLARVGALMAAPGESPFRAAARLAGLLRRA
jgi:LAO/AO transport system kinase